MEILTKNRSSMAALTKCIVAFILLSFQQLSYSEPIQLNISPSGNDYLISPKIKYYRDDTNGLTASEVSSLKNEVFSSFPKGEYVLPANHDIYWLKFSLRNAVNYPTTWYLNNLGTEVELFRLYQVMPSGEVKLISDRSLDQDVGYYESAPNVRLDLEAQQQVEYLLQIRQFRLNAVVMHVSDQKNSELRQRYVWGFLALYTGCMLGLIAYNFFLFLSLKDPAYFWYVAFAANMLLGVNFTTRFFDPIGIHFGSAGVHFGVALLATVPGVAAMFCRSFLKLKFQNLIANRLALVLFGITIVNAFATILFYSQWSFALIKITNILVFILVGVSGVQAMRAGFAPAKYYLISWGIFLVSVIYWTMGQINLVEISHFNAYIAIFGNMLEMMTMSLALGRRVRALQDERYSAIMKAREGESYRRLVRIMCHDIVNPLSIILGHISISRKKFQDVPKLDKVWDKLDRAGYIISNLIDSVRDMEKQKTNGGKFELAAVNLKDAVSHVNFVFSRKLEDKDLSLQSSGLDKDVLVMAEAHTLYNEVLSNVVSNAIKFSSPGGSIEINVLQSSGKVRVEIRDYGMGMPEKIRQSLFDPNVASSQIGTQDEAGTGFGMPLVFDFMKIYGGNVKVSSVEKNGDSENESSGTLIELEFVSLVV